MGKGESSHSMNQKMTDAEITRINGKFSAATNQKGIIKCLKKIMFQP